MEEKRMAYSTSATQMLAIKTSDPDPLTPCKHPCLVDNLRNNISFRNPLLPLRLCPPRNGDTCRVDHSHQPNNHHQNVTASCPRSFSHAFVVQVRWVDVHQRYARKATNKRNEFVEIAGANGRDHTAEKNESSAESILLPFRHAALLAGRTSENLELDSTHRREELHRRADKHCHGVKKLYCIDELAGLREIGDHLNGHIVAKSAVAQNTHGCEDDRDDEHDDVEQFTEVLGLCHARLDREYKPDALKCEDGRSNGHGEVARVEELNSRVETSHFADPGYIVPVNVGQADEDEDVSEKGRRAQFGDIADKGERDQCDELDANQGVCR